MVFLFYLIITLIIISTLLLFSKIKIEIINFRFTSLNKRHVNKEYKIVVKLYILEKIPITKINITKTKLEKQRIKEKLEKIDVKAIQNKIKIDKNFFKAIKKINMQIKKINLNMELGTENAMLTSAIVPAISTIIAIYLRKKIKNYENQTFIIQPVYQNQNLINIYISGIFEIKMIHIIDMLYRLNKKGEVKRYERTSDRRTYDYSYE